jgi:hypothetical protein
VDRRYVRGRAFNLSLLATAHAAQSEPEQACNVGRQALDLTVRLTSARSVRNVRDLVRRLRSRADIPAVRDFTAEARERRSPCTTHLCGSVTYRHYRPGGAEHRGHVLLGGASDGRFV